MATATLPQLEEIASKETTRIPETERAYCNHCSREFDIRQVVRGDYGGIYCSKECRNLFTED